VREVGWIDSGGGFSHVFARPSYQNTLPDGSTPIGAMRGVPDVGYQASSRTGVLVYDTAAGDAQGGLNCPAGNPCSAGWYVVRRDVLVLPAVAGLVAISDQIAGRGSARSTRPCTHCLRPNYSLLLRRHHGQQQADPNIPGYPATTGWDPAPAWAHPTPPPWCRPSPATDRPTPGGSRTGSPGRAR